LIIWRIAEQVKKFSNFCRLALVLLCSEPSWGLGPLGLLRYYGPKKERPGRSLSGEMPSDGGVMASLNHGRQNHYWNDHGHQGQNQFLSFVEQ
jgi:hypothetical protein